MMQKKRIRAWHIVIVLIIFVGALSIISRSLTRFSIEKRAEPVVALLHSDGLVEGESQVEKKSLYVDAGISNRPYLTVSRSAAVKTEAQQLLLMVQQKFVSAQFKLVEKKFYMTCGIPTAILDFRHVSNSTDVGVTISSKAVTDEYCGGNGPELQESEVQGITMTRIRATSTVY